MIRTNIKTPILVVVLVLNASCALGAGPYGYTLMGLACAAGNKNTPIIATAELGRVSSAPYITGDGFRNYANFRFDEMNEQFRPQDVRPGNVIFVKIEYIDEFFTKIHPYIPCRYILLTHNSDPGIPGKHYNRLNDHKIIAWFGQNVEGPLHAKLHAIPLGIANKYWHHGDPKVFDAARNGIPTLKKKILLYMNFDVTSCMVERGYVRNLFKDQSFVTHGKGEAMYNHLIEVAQCKFVLSPRGGGLDCHRTWEALYMGAIPIIKSSASDYLFDGLPVLIVKNWTEVTQELLKNTYEKMSKQTYRLEKLTLDYWLKMIDEYKKQA
jgi:hypothetical protein